MSLEATNGKTKSRMMMAKVYWRETGSLGKVVYSTEAEIEDSELMFIQ